jgi:hypothetical protein
MGSTCGLSSAARSDVAPGSRLSDSRGRRLRFGIRLGLIAAAATVAAIGASPAGAPRFYPDDPIQADDDKAIDASKVAPFEDSNGYDFVVNTFTTPGERRNVRAMNVNTVDEVPDSSWFVNRIGRAPMSEADLVRGPDRVESVSLDGWVVSGGKSTGLQPGFRMRDPSGHTFQIEFDPPSNPEMATGAEVMGTAFYHAFGYHTVEVYLTELDPERLTISEKATVFDRRMGRRRRVTQADLDDVFRRAARRPDGKYRVLASRFAEGAPLGNFRYYGTRPDDPNDIVAHEHRRELRGARVFGAWLNHDDSRGVNSLDMLDGDKSHRYVKHYMFDFGSILGSGTVFAQRHRPGNEYILDWTPGWLTLATLGLYTRPWMHISYPEVPASVGRFEAEAFDALKWKPEYPNPAFENMRPDDAFWAARIVSRFDEPAIRAIVGKGRFSDPRASAYLTETLLKRREKVLRAWLTQVCPLVDFALSEAGELTFADAAVQAGVSTPATSYRIRWSRFDNASGSSSPVGDELVVSEARVRAPASLVAPDQAPPFLQVDIAATHPQFPSWPPVTVHFRRVESGWKLVGLQRHPDEQGH